MTDLILAAWFMILFFGLIPIVYKALTALDFEKLFRRNSTWEIRLLVLLFSVIIAYLTSSAFIAVLEKIIFIIVG